MGVAGSRRSGKRPVDVDAYPAREAAVGCRRRGLGPRAATCEGSAAAGEGQVVEGLARGRCRGLPAGG